MAFKRIFGLQQPSPRLRNEVVPEWSDASIPAKHLNKSSLLDIHLRSFPPPPPPDPSRRPFGWQSSRANEKPPRGNLVEKIEFHDITIQLTDSLMGNTLADDIAAGLQDALTQRLRDTVENLDTRQAN